MKQFLVSMNNIFQNINKIVIDTGPLFTVLALNFLEQAPPHYTAKYQWYDEALGFEKRFKGIDKKNFDEHLIKLINDIVDNGMHVDHLYILGPADTSLIMIAAKEKCP